MPFGHLPCAEHEHEHDCFGLFSLARVDWVVALIVFAVGFVVMDGCVSTGLWALLPESVAEWQ